MNRYIAAGFLATVVAFLGAGLESFGRLLPSFESAAGQGRRAESTFGTQPIQQAGRVVQAESSGASIAPATTLGDSRTPIQGTTVSPQDFPAVEIRPRGDDVIPRTGQAPAGTATSGDVSPIQPDLVQPGTSEGPGPDQDLDSIPALW